MRTFMSNAWSGTFARKAGSVLLDVVILYIVLEVVLRLFPVLVPPSLLVDFHPNIRKEIAGRVGVSRSELTTPLVRTDGGAPINLYRPYAEVSNRFEDQGAVMKVTMDAEGFCNVPNQSGGEKQYGIILLGDSTTWCTAVQPSETFSHVLGEEIDRVTYNMAAIGVGPFEYLQILKGRGIQHDPAVVLMSIYEGNDLRDVLAYHDYRKKVGESGGESIGSAPCSLPGFLCPVYRSLKEGWIGRESYAFNLLSNAARKGVEQVRLFARGESGESEKKGINFRYRVKVDAKDVLFNTRDYDLEEVDFARALSLGELSAKSFREPLEIFRDLGRSEDFLPVVTYIPSAYTTYADLVTFDDPEVGRVLAEGSERQRQELKKIANELGVQFLDLTPALQSKARNSGEELLHLPINLHLTKLGHRTVAEAIALFMRVNPKLLFRE